MQEEGQNSCLLARNQYGQDGHKYQMEISSKTAKRVHDNHWHTKWVMAESWDWLVVPGWKELPAGNWSQWCSFPTYLRDQTHQESCCCNSCRMWFGIVLWKTLNLHLWMQWCTVLTDNSFTKCSWAPLVISITEFYRFLMQCLRDQAVLVFSLAPYMQRFLQIVWIFWYYGL